MRIGVGVVAQEIKPTLGMPTSQVRVPVLVLAMPFLIQFSVNAPER